MQGCSQQALVSANHKDESVVTNYSFIQVEGANLFSSVDEIAWNYPVLYVVKSTHICQDSCL